RELAATLAGRRAVDAVVREAEAIGLMARIEGQIVLHPLAATFLLRRGADIGAERPIALARCLDYYRSKRTWDPLFDVILRENTLSELEDALPEALNDLLNAGRLAMIRAVIDAADSAGMGHPVIDIARAEVALREGNTFAAGAHAMNAF